MNAIIALCHFCEAHGPSAIFCTQTLRGTNLNNLCYSDETQQNNIAVSDTKNCSICNSVGTSIGIVSKDPNSNANFLSTQTPIIPEVRSLLKQASIRSLSCEVNCNNKDAFVFFGDSSRGHILSHTFQINDLQARGFYQLFSIIVLMKDKFFLLNIKPFLSEHLQKISNELKSKAKIVYNLEQENENERSRRLSSNNENGTIRSPRSLIELTNDKNIFYILHTHFTWILLAGTKILTEQITFSKVLLSPPASTIKINDELLASTIQGQDEVLSGINSTLNFNSDCNIVHPSYPIYFRQLKHYFKSDFNAACYCALSGIKIIIRGPPEHNYNALMCFRKMLPDELHKLTHFNSVQYLTHISGKIVTVPPDIPVPLPSDHIYRIDFLNENETSIKWHGITPKKFPSILNKIIRVLDESLFTDVVLEKHLKVLVEEWKNKVICLNCVKSQSGAAKMEKVLGIQEHDIPLINYWKQFL